jgi:hypothetical protein
LSDGTTVSAVAFNGTTVELTLSKTYAHTETAPTVDYSGNTATDGIGFIAAEIIPTTLAAFSDVAVTNATPDPGSGLGGPDPEP